MADPNIDSYIDQYDSGTLPKEVQLQAETPSLDTFMDKWDREHPTIKPGVEKPETPIGQAPPPKVKQEPPKTLTGYLSETVKPFYDFLADENKIGMAGVHEGEEGVLAQYGKQSYEDAEAHLESDKAMLEETHKKVDAFRDANAAYKAFSIVEPAARMMPFLAHLAGAYGAGAVTGAGIGAAIGTAIAAPTGESIAPLTIPAAAIANGALGGDAAVFTATSALMGGNAYMKFRREGHSQDEAALWGTALGVVQGSIGSLRFAQVAGTLKSQIAKAAQPLMQSALVQYGKMIGAQSALGATQELSALVMETALAHSSNRKGEAPTLDESIQRLSQAARDSAVQAAALASGVEGAKAVWKIPRTLPQTLRVLKQAAQNPQSNLAELPSPEPPPKPVEPVKLEEEIPKEETRTKAEIERDETRETLKGRVRETVSERKRLESKLERHQAEINRLRPDRNPNDKFYLKSAELNKEVTRQELRLAKENEAELTKKQIATENEHHKIEMKRLKSIAARTESPTQGGVPNSRMERGTDIQSTLNRIRHYIKNQDDVALTIDKYNAAEKNNSITPELHNEYDAANFVRNLSDKESSEVRQIANDIKLAYETGKAGRIKQLADKSEKRFILLAKFREAAQGANPKNRVEADVNPPSKAPLDLSKGKIAPGLLNFFGNYLAKWKFVLRDAPDRDELLKEIGVREELTKIDKQTMDNDKMLMGHLTRETGKTAPQVNELIRLGAKNKISITVYTGGKEGIEELPKQSLITINQAIDKLAQLSDPDAAKALYEGNKFMPEELGALSTKQEIIDKLSTEDEAYVKMADGYVAAYKELYPRLAKEFKEAFGEELPNNQFYSGTIRHLKNDAPGQQEFEAQMKQRRTAYKTGTAAKPGATMERTGDTSALAYEDMHQKFSRNSRQTEHWIGMREKSKEVLGPLLRDPELGRIIDRKYLGNALLKSMREDLSDIIYGNSDKKSDWGDFLNEHLLKNTSIFMLASKPLMFVKHILSFQSAANHMPVVPLIKGVVEFYSNPIKNSRDLVKTNEYITRHGKEDLNTAVTAQMPEEMKHPFFKSVDHFVMAPTIYGIKATDLAILYAARKYFITQGMTEAQAITKGGEILHNTQVSAAIDMTSSLSRSSLGKLVTLFQGQVTNLATETYIAWDRWMAIPNKENFAYAVKTSLVSGISLAIFEGVNAVYKYALAPDDKARDEAMYEGFTAAGLGMIPIINYPLIKDFTKGVGTLVLDKLGDQDFKVPEMSGLLTSLGENWIKAGTDYLRAANDPEWADEHTLQLIIDADNTIGWKIGSPLKSPLDFAHKLEMSQRGE